MPSLVDILKGLIVAAITAGIVTWAHQKVLEERLAHLQAAHAQRITALERRFNDQSRTMHDLVVFQAMQAERNRVADEMRRGERLRWEYAAP